MDLMGAMILGVLQGLTEFLPVSSSGHLALFGRWLGVEEPDLTFDILVHLATLAAILVYFHRDWRQLASFVIRREQGDLPAKILWFLPLSMVPAGLVGVFLKDQITAFHDQPVWVGVCLWITGIALLLGLRTREGHRELKDLTLVIVLTMAIAQALAILPGISRSGATIMAGVFLGMERRGAARFSFLMAVPVIGGAGVLAFKDLLERGASITGEQWLAYGIGSLAALFSGFFALAFMMRLLDGRRFFLFGFYCLLLGSAAILLG